jgi:hypothetical protein
MDLPFFPQPAMDARKLTNAYPGRVNLHCSNCHTRLGSFSNDWVRLTSSYAKPTRAGTQEGFEAGNKIKHVPNGESHRALEGCGLSEVFCTECSIMIGQYCRSAPDQEKEALV